MKKLIYACAISSTMLAPLASASDLMLNGFASIYGGTNLDEDTVKYGYEDKMTFKNESLFGLQASASLDDGLSATLQLASRGSNDFDVEATWAYIAYDIDDHSSIKMGRIRVPFYEY